MFIVSMWRHIILLIVICGAGLVAGEADPFTNLDPHTNTKILANLRDTLGSAPASDPRLIIAEMALVNLALAGDPRDRGGRGGIWRQRARELRDMRRAAAVKPTTFLDTVPDLWISVLDGQTAACLVALGQYPDSADHPHARALRCWATTDWRALQACTNASAHERLALAMAYWRSHMSQALGRLDQTGLPPFAFASLQVATEEFTHQGTAQVLTEAMIMAAPLTASPKLPTTAQPQVQDLAESLKITELGEPSQRIRIFSDAMRQDQAADHGETIIAAWHLAEAALVGPRGLQDDQGAWTLIGLGDWATNVRLNLFLGTWHRHYFVRNLWSVAEVADRIAQPVVAGDHGVFGPFTQMMSGKATLDIATARTLLKGIDAELVRPSGGLPPMRLVGCVHEVRLKFRALRDECVRVLGHLLTAQIAAESGRAAGWEEFGRVFKAADLLPRIADPLATAASGDPWSPELEQLSNDAKRTSKTKSANTSDDQPLINQIARMPWRVDLAAKRFDHLFGSEKWAEAETLGATILAIEPGNEQVGRRYGECLMKQNKTDEAIAAWRSYLVTSTAFNTIFVHLDIAKALEKRNDLVGAEAEFLAAANSWQGGAMQDYALFLGRQNRKAEALIWMDRAIERYGRGSRDLVAVQVLLAGNPTPADMDAAMIRLAEHKDVLMTSAAAWDVGMAIRRASLQDQFLKMLNGIDITSKHGLQALIALMTLESGHPEEAAEQFAAEVERSKLSAVGWILSLQTLSARLGKRPDLEVSPDALRQRIGKSDFMKITDPLLRYLAGDIDRPTAIKQVGSADGADELYYYLGIDAAAKGDLKTARDDWLRVISHPDWSEAGGAKRLIQWLDDGAKVKSVAPDKTISF